MKKEPLIFIEHIKESINNILSFSKNIEKKYFLKNKLLQSAVIRQIEILGEAVKNLPDEFTDKYSFVSWSEIARARDKIIHQYFGIDLDEIWNIILKDIPKLKKDINEIIKKEIK